MFLFLSSTTGIVDATDPKALGGNIENGTNSSEKSLGFLFDTFVPLSSILTIFITVGFTLPRHEYFGIFWLVWWVVAVFVSLLSVGDDLESHESIEHGGRKGGLFPSSSTSDKMSGLVVLVVFPILMLLILLIWWKREEHSSPLSRLKKDYHRWALQRSILPTILPIREFVLKNVPLWSMVAIHIYRLDGLSILVPFWNGNVPNVMGYQTIILDVIMGITAIPLTYLLYVPSNQRNIRPYAAKTDEFSKRSKSPGFLKDVLWFWNSLGLYDLSSAYLVLVLNICGWGGPHITRPPLLPRLGRHPFPLLLLFQAPLAIAVHVLMLTHSEELTKEHQKQLQNSRDPSLVLPTIAITNRKK